MFRCCVWLPESIFSRDAGCLQPHAEIMWPRASNTLFVYVSEVWNCVKHYMLVAEHASRSNIEYMERLDKLEVPCIAQFSLVCSRPSWLVAAFNPVIMLGLGVRDGSISSETATQFYCVLSFIFADDITWYHHCWWVYYQDAPGLLFQSHLCWETRVQFDWK